MVSGNYFVFCVTGAFNEFIKVGLPVEVSTKKLRTNWVPDNHFI
jgi:hypothetical protein